MEKGREVRRSVEVEIQLASELLYYACMPPFLHSLCKAYPMLCSQRSTGALDFKMVSLLSAFHV